MLKIKSMLCTSTLALLFSMHAHALQVNLTLDKDIIKNEDKLNIFYDLYFPDSSVSQQIKGMTQQIFALWIDAFNKENKDLTPIDIEGKQSEMNLGYKKGDHDYYIESCQHIRLTGVKNINILLNEKGCVINSY